MKEIFAIILTFVLIGACVCFGPNIHEHFGKRYGDADRHIFERTKSYVHGKIENLHRLRLDYETTEELEHKEALRRIILIESTMIEKEHLPYELDKFIQELENNNLH